MLRALAKGDLAGAYKVLIAHNPLPGVTGRLLADPFEQTQVYNRHGEKISLRQLERFIADHVKPDRPVIRSGQIRQKVVIVGSGVSALTAASLLAYQGFGVKVYEQSHLWGGSLSYAYGEFHLPNQILARIISQIRSLGVEFLANAIVGRSVLLEDLVEEHGFSAALLCTGVDVSGSIGFEGESVPGVMDIQEAMKLSRWFRPGKIDESSPVWLGKNVVILGASAMALEFARTARRLRCEVTVVMNETEGQMDVDSQRMSEAVEEGVRFKTSMRPIKAIVNPSGCVKGITCQHVRYHSDGTGIRTMVLDKDSEVILEADTIVNASAQKSNTMFLKGIKGLDIQENGSVATAKDSCQTSLRKVFAAGRCVNSSLDFVGVMLSAKAAAQEIHKFLI